MARLGRPAVFLVTSGAARRKVDEGWQAAISGASRAAAAGIDVIQVREPDLPDRALAELVRTVVGETDGSQTMVVVNDRPDVAVSAGAAGVHLRADGMPAARVRMLAPPGFLVGRSVHSLAEAREAALEGAVDYLFFGTVFRSASKSAGHEVQGTEALRIVCQSVGLPVIAIGGITARNAPEIAAAGAAGLAAIGLFAEGSLTEPGGLPALVRELREAFG
jgi:thiamine-phosphate pyrophosphorylase